MFNRTIQLYVADIIILRGRCRNRQKLQLSVNVMNLIESVGGKLLLNMIIYKAQYKFKVCWSLNFYIKGNSLQIFIISTPIQKHLRKIEFEQPVVCIHSKGMKGIPVGIAACKKSLLFFMKRMWRICFNT